MRNISNRIIVCVSILLTLAYWTILIFHFSLFQIVRGYFWHAMVWIDKPLDAFWIFPLIVIVSIVIIYIILKYTGQIKINLLLLILLGFFIQMGFGFMEGQGIDGIRSRIIKTGHAEFARLAVFEDDLIEVAVNYEEFIKQDTIIKYAHTKPPGQLLFYMITQKISNSIKPEQNLIKKHNRLVTFASYAYPLISYLVIIPLYFFSRLFLSKNQAIVPCMLYIFIPNVTLVTLHLDQVLYPLLFMTTLYISSVAAMKRSIPLAIVGGAVLYLSLYISFSLLPMVIFSIVAVMVFSMTGDANHTRIRSSLIILAGFIGGVIVLFFLFKLLLNYNPLLRYENAMKYHQIWKVWEPGFKNTILFASLNFIEFVCWTGIPLVVFYLAGLGKAIRNIFEKRLSQIDYFSLSLAIVFVLLGLLGKTKGEVSRLWIFLVPLLCVFVCFELLKRFKGKENLAFSILLTVQMTTIMLIKRFQDFW